MATLCLINFPEFLNQEILKIRQSEVCVGGGGAKGRIIKLSLSVPNYTQKLYQKWISAVRVRCFKFRNWEKFIKEGPTQGKLDFNDLEENTANAQYWNVAYILTSRYQKWISKNDQSCSIDNLRG